jgi:hypothetical protein
MEYEPLCEICGTKNEEIPYYKYPLGESEGIYWHMICAPCSETHQDYIYCVYLPPIKSSQNEG